MKKTNLIKAEMNTIHRTGRILMVFFLACILLGACWIFGCREEVMAETIEGLLDTPQISSVSNTATGIQLQWEAVDGAEAYVIWRGESADDESYWDLDEQLATTSSTSYIDTTVTEGVTYYYRICCLDEYGYMWSLFSDAVSGYWMEKVEYGFIINEFDIIRIEFREVTGADGYYIFRKEGSGSWTQVGTILSSNEHTYYSYGTQEYFQQQDPIFDDPNVESGKTYTYYVRPYYTNEGITYMGSYDTMSIYRIDRGNITGITNSSSGLTIKWSKIVGASGYYVYRYTVTGGIVPNDSDFPSLNYVKVKTITSGSTVSWTDTSVKDSYGYYYYVTPYYKDSTGTILTGTFSKQVEAWRIANCNVSSLTNTTSGVTIKWNKISAAEGYNIYRKTGSGTYTKIKTITSNTTVSYTDTAVKSKSGTTYSYYVQAFSGPTCEGNMVYSAYTSKSIRRLSSGTVSSLTNTSSGITVKWSKITGANGYYIYRKSGTGSYKLAKTITSGSTTSWSDTAVKSKNGTTYTYYVIPYYKNSSGTVTKGSYTASKKMVRLTAVSISSLKNSSSKKMTVKWAKNSKATGYQIQYSTSSSFASGNKTVTVSGASTVSKVISSLKKGKTYYVRIRAYKSVSGTKYYSAWSSKKSVKISK